MRFTTQCVPPTNYLAVREKSTHPIFTTKLVTDLPHEHIDSIILMIGNVHRIEHVKNNDTKIEVYRMWISA